MPNHLRSGRDKKEKEMKRKNKKNPKPVYKKPPAEDMDLSPSSSEAEEEADSLSHPLVAETEVAKNKAPSNDALDNSLSSFTSLIVFCSRTKSVFKEEGQEQLSLYDGGDTTGWSEEVSLP
jgi:hypothetical protein